MKVQMSEEKQSADSPTFVIRPVEMESSPKAINKKKIVIFVVGGIVVVAVILIAILVGMYFFTKTQKEILQYSLQLDKNTKEDVTSDPNTNIVRYHVRNNNYEAWLYNDFNQDIQVVKLTMDSTTNCYSSPLNRSEAGLDPSSMTVPYNKDVSKYSNRTVRYSTANTPIPDTSFLSKTVREACKGISIYWTYPSCDLETGKSQRQKRECRCWQICFFVCYTRCRDC